ncbi:MAG: hypothetical protein HY885_08405 [Deltaproteobacteria bacterium]|nr:hypothetical protein [Deltaproteobacteria bacterium]
MENIRDHNIRQLINLSELLVTLSGRYALTTDDEKSLIFYGTVLDNACKLRLTAKKLWNEPDGHRRQNKEKGKMKKENYHEKKTHLT